MKKIVCIIISILMVISLAACGNKDAQPTNPVDDTIVNPTDGNDVSVDIPQDNVDSSEPVEDNITNDEVAEDVEFTYAEELSVALLSQTGSVAPTATMRLDLSDATSVKDATGIEDISKVKNVAITQSVDDSKVFEIIIIAFTDTETAANNTETIKTTLAVKGDSCEAAAIKNYVVAVVMNSADSDIVSAKGICDKFVEMMEDEANIYFPTRHLYEEPPVETDEAIAEDNTDVPVSNEDITEPEVAEPDNNTNSEDAAG